MNENKGGDLTKFRGARERARGEGVPYLGISVEVFPELSQRPLELGSKSEKTI